MVENIHVYIKYAKGIASNVDLIQTAPHEEVYSRHALFTIDISFLTFRISNVHTKRTLNSQI